MKPDNIFIVRNDEEEIAKVLDFGVAKSHTHGMGAVSSATRTGSVLGTPYYMSPEQAEGSKIGRSIAPTFGRMGVIAWECLLGARPFEAETLGGLLLAICAREMPVPSRMGPVPAGFDAWFARACSRNVANRFVSAKELAAELRQVCAGAGRRSALTRGSGVEPARGCRAGIVPAARVDDRSSGHVVFARAVEEEVGGAAGDRHGRRAGDRRGGRCVRAAFAFQRDGGQRCAVGAATRAPQAEPAIAPAAAPEPKPEPSVSASAAPVASSAPAPVRGSVRPRGVAPATKPVKGKEPAAAAAPAPAPAAQPQPRPRVNLGI